MNYLNQPKRLEIKSEQQYYLFLEYLSYRKTRKFGDLASNFNCSERTIYAYAKKFDWVNRAKIEDKKRTENQINDERNRS